MEQIFGFIERITFQNLENGFTVARLKEPKKTSLTCVVGTLPALKAGENVRLLGHWKHNNQHGTQFEVRECHIEKPVDLHGIQKYLESGLIKGIGPAFASRIVKKFGLKTLDVIEENPEALLEVEGIGEKRIENIISSWKAQQSIRELMIFLKSHEISPGFASKIYKRFGDESIAILRSDPFLLAKEIPGIGFKSADKIAEKIGIPKDSAQRVDAAIEFTLHELSEDGHTCYPLQEFLEISKERLECNILLIQERIEVLKSQNRVHIENVEEQEFIWHTKLYLSECGIARELKRIQKGHSSLRAVNTEKALEWVEKKLSIELAEKQKEAVVTALTEKVMIITGGPGTGKSTITKSILTILRELSKKIILAAPTGKAAKRMTEITGWAASTIHSLLQYDFTVFSFKRNRENPLTCDLIIVDESSMIDTYLMYSLLKAIPSTARLILIGDINQLPSVGPGNVLKDIIESGLVVTTQLMEIFRQALGSKIITNAHKINEGVFPDLKSEAKSDFFFIKKETPEELLQGIIHLITERLPKFTRFNPIRDIQVLAPMKRGIIGIENLNQVLQKTLNPQKEGIAHAGRLFFTGDKVMQIRNNPQKEVFNGDSGIITSIDRVQETVEVTIDDKIVSYDFHELDEIVLAYACSVHKYQGSECPCVIIPIHTTHFMMLHRNLLYTAVTRGKKMVILMGIAKAIAIAVANDEIKKRFTNLKHLILIKN